MKWFGNSIRSLVTFLAGVSVVAASAGEVTVSLSEVQDALKKAHKGDIINIAPGTFTDVQLKWKAPGVPVTVRAQQPGTVVIKGRSGLNIAGDSLTVSGLDFRKVEPKKQVVDFRIGDKLANACRLTDCVLDSCNPIRRDDPTSYIVLHGRNNRVDHCALTGKTGLGVTLIVNLNDARSLKNYHSVDHNYFGPRPVYGSNGAETIRMGTSQQSDETCGTQIANNMFHRCNGEVEVVSVKSCDNVVKDNLFLECEGVVALRHGKRNTVTGNRFIGNGRRNTGGVRVVDTDHVITDNVFQGLAGGRFFSAFVLMEAVPNSLPNRYVRVGNVKAENNVFAGCANIQFGTGKDAERTEAPVACSFSNNTIYTDAKGKPWTFVDAKAEVKTDGNKILPLEKYAFQEITEEDVAGYGPARVQNKLSEVAEGGIDIYHMAGGVEYRTEPLVVSRETIIEGNGTVWRWKGDKPDNFITIVDGGKLTIKGVTFDFALQQGHTVVRNGIATDKNMAGDYTLIVQDCAFINSPEGGCCGIRGGKGTFAPMFMVTGSRFSDLSGNGIMLADETEDAGKYSADDIHISGCEFSNILGIPVNIYRGGSDESTAGPYVYLNGNTFTNCCNKERGSVMRLIGPQILHIKDCSFTESGRGGATIRLDEATWEDVEIKGCKWNNSGRVISNRNVINK